jgi:hypothetical protein
MPPDTVQTYAHVMLRTALPLRTSPLTSPSHTHHPCEFTHFPNRPRTSWRQVVASNQEIAGDLQDEFSSRVRSFNISSAKTHLVCVSKASTPCHSLIIAATKERAKCPSSKSGGGFSVEKKLRRSHHEELQDFAYQGLFFTLCFGERRSHSLLQHNG